MRNVVRYCNVAIAWCYIEVFERGSLNVFQSSQPSESRPIMAEEIEPLKIGQDGIDGWLWHQISVAILSICGCTVVSELPGQCSKRDTPMKALKSRANHKSISSGNLVFDFSRGCYRFWHRRPGSVKHTTFE